MIKECFAKEKDHIQSRRFYLKKMINKHGGGHFSISLPLCCCLPLWEILKAFLAPFMLEEWHSFFCFVSSTNVHYRPVPVYAFLVDLYCKTWTVGATSRCWQSANQWRIFKGNVSLFSAKSTNLSQPTQLPHSFFTAFLLDFK